MLDTVSSAAATRRLQMRLRRRGLIDAATSGGGLGDGVVGSALGGAGGGATDKLLKLKMTPDTPTDPTSTPDINPQQNLVDPTRLPNKQLVNLKQEPPTKQELNAEGPPSLVQVAPERHNIVTLQPGSNVGPVEMYDQDTKPQSSQITQDGGEEEEEEEEEGGSGGAGAGAGEDDNEEEEEDNDEDDDDEDADDEEE